MYPLKKIRVSFLCALGTTIALCGLSTRSISAATYVFATFKGDTDPGEKLSIYTSTDGLNFTLLSDTGFEGTSSTLRDPSIMKHTDGKYYVAYTNPPTASCCGKEDHFSIASSTDLIHWTNVTTVSAGVPGVAHTWAPEWFVDQGIVHIIASVDTLNSDSDFKPYVFTAQNNALTSWSGPIAMGIGPNYIDTFVMKVGTTYHCFTKQETTRFLEHATASNLTGPWKFVGTGDWAGWGSGLEGPCIIQLDNGTYRLFTDSQRSIGFPYSDSPDLNTWSALKPIPNGLTNLRHGTIIKVVSSPAGAYEAESAVLSGGAILESTHLGFSGSGYVNSAVSGSTIAFNSVASDGGMKSLSIRYALGSTASRTGSLVVNGIPRSITFAPTGAWETWVELKVTVALNAGASNKIALSSTGQDLANIDRLTVLP